MKDYKGIKKDVGIRKVSYVCQCEDLDCGLEIELLPGEKREIVKRNQSDPGDRVYLIHPTCRWGLNEIEIGLYQIGEENERFIVQV